MPGGRLTQEDRRRIATWLAEGLAHAEIGRRLSRPTSTITREVNRNRGPAGYQADQPLLLLAPTGAIRPQWASSSSDSPRRSCRWECQE